MNSNKEIAHSFALAQQKTIETSACLGAAYVNIKYLFNETDESKENLFQKIEAIVNTISEIQEELAELEDLFLLKAEGIDVQ